MIRILIWLFLIVVIVVGGLREIHNHLEKPTLETIAIPEADIELLLYHKGRTHREAVLFYQSIDSNKNKEPIPVATIYYSESSNSDKILTGAIYWTKDETSIFARKRNNSKEILWIFDVHTKQILKPPVIDQERLAQIVAAKQGIGTSLVHWYEMGIQPSERLYSWQSSYWRRLSKK